MLFVGLGLLPHLALEAFAYSVGAVAGADLGRRLTMQADLQIESRSFVIAGAVLAVASALEAFLPGAVIRSLDTLGTAV